MYSQNHKIFVYVCYCLCVQMMLFLWMAHSCKFLTMQMEKWSCVSLSNPTVIAAALLFLHIMLMTLKILQHTIWLQPIAPQHHLQVVTFLVYSLKMEATPWRNRPHLLPFHLQLSPSVSSTSLMFWIEILTAKNWASEYLIIARYIFSLTCHCPQMVAVSSVKEMSPLT